MDVISHHSERGFIALAGELGIGGRRGNLGNTSIAIYFGSWNGSARIQVPNHSVNFLINKFLRGRCTLFGIGSIVFSQQFELDFFTADGNAFCIQFFDGHARAILIVFSQMGNGAAQRCYMADFYDFRFL